MHTASDQITFLFVLTKLHRTSEQLPCNAAPADDFRIILSKVTKSTGVLLAE